MKKRKLLLIFILFSTIGFSQQQVLTKKGKLTSLTKVDVGLGNVDNTSDANKPVSTATQTALDAKVSLGGDLTGTVVEPTITNASVISKVLTGYSAGAGTVSDSDTLLQALQKLDGNDGLKANLSSPDFTGIPKAPTVTDPTDNSTKIATTAFVKSTIPNITDDNTSITFNNKPISGYSARVVTITTTSYTLLQIDNGKVLVFDNTSDITLTISSGLTNGFNCLVVQKNVGNVIFIGSGTTIVLKSGLTKTGGQFAVASVLGIADNYFVIGGDLQ